MKKFLREPFLHFLLIGAALFLVFRVTGSGEAREDVIIIDDSDLDRLINTWEMQWQRPPTKEEFSGLLQQHLRKEVYYREALKMRLDHNDEIVKRRLYQKLEFLMDDMAELTEPTEDELRDYYEANKEKYQVSDVLSYTSVYFNPDVRSDARADAERVLDQLPETVDRDYSTDEYGDASMLEAGYWNISRSALTRYMGTAFTDTVFQLEPGGWRGPLPSGYGWHLVYVFDRTPVESPEWEHVRSRVKTDFMYDRRNAYSDAVYEELQKNYEVVYDFKDERFKPGEE